MTKAREKFFFVIVMPLNEQGQGPVHIKEATQLTFEVWSQELDNMGSFEYLADALDKADELNEIKAEEVMK